MRFMMILKADKNTEAGALPTRDDLEVMGRYNRELIDAGVLLQGEGLQPSSKGARMTFENGEPRVVNGPFEDTNTLIAGYWVIQVKSKEEAIEWAKRVPFDRLPSVGRTGPEIELRQLYEIADFPDIPEDVAELEESFAGRSER